MKKVILVVDDSLIIRRQLSTALVAAGFETVQAVDGQDALTQVAQLPQVDLIISDVNMPRMSGVELLENIRQNPRFAETPFVMLTSDGQTALIQRARELGAKGWIKKPFNADLMVATAQKLAS